MQHDDDSGHSRKAVLLLVDEHEMDAAASGSIVNLVLRHWRWIALSALTAAIAALAYGLVAPKWYRAQATISPVAQESGQSALGAMSGDLGGLAALAGLDLGNNEDFKNEALARLSSREFIYGFLRDEGLMPILFADEWDARNERWRSADRDEQPSLEQAYRKLMADVVTVSEDRRNGLIKITVDWKDPALASALANKLITRINGDIREVARAEAVRNLEFLNRELAKTPFVELRQAINRLIESEIKKLMLVNVREQYAFKVIDPAFVLGREGIVKPRLALLLASASILGGLAGLFVALAFSQRKSANLAVNSKA